MKNPLLNHQSLPEFSSIKPEHAEPALDIVLQKNTQALQHLLDNTEDFNWANFIEPIEAMEDRLHHLWSPVSHLHSVMNSDAWREVYTNCLPKLTEYHTKLGHNKALYEAYLALQKNNHALDEAQKKLLDDSVRDFTLSGIALNETEKTQFAALEKELAELATKFEQNLLDATQDFKLTIDSIDELKGLPEHAIAAAKEKAEKEKTAGYVLTLDFPCYNAVMKYCDNSKIREALYRAYSTRATDNKPEWDNTEVMVNLLKNRQALAGLLGFENFSTLSIATKMADSPKEVLDFLNTLANKAKLKAHQDFEALQTFAQEHEQTKDLKPWDTGYYSEKMRQHLFDIDQEKLREYFPLEKVLKGMFSIIRTLYQITIEPCELETWHPDVRCFQLKNQANELVGTLYMDLYARENKRGGAWMDECQSRRRLPDNSMQKPAAYLSCNFTPVVGDNPSLLNHEEVITLFHEMGHCLHHLLTKINYMDISGINGVEWDAVEQPSQFFENYCWEKETIALISEHYQTGDALPEKLLNQMIAAKQFQSGLFLVRQLTFALFDFDLHLKNPSPDAAEIHQLLEDIRENLSPYPTPDYNRFQNSFSHIFAGGYAAGYYSYLWAELLSHDVFSKFKENGVLNEKTGQAFLEKILSQGGSKNAMDLFMDFRGRKPSIDALLEAHGV